MSTPIDIVLSFLAVSENPQERRDAIVRKGLAPYLRDPVSKLHSDSLALICSFLTEKEMCNLSGTNKRIHNLIMEGYSENGIFPVWFTASRMRMESRIHDMRTEEIRSWNYLNELFSRAIVHKIGSVSQAALVGSSSEGAPAAARAQASRVELPAALCACSPPLQSVSSSEEKAIVSRLEKRIRIPHICRLDLSGEEIDGESLKQIIEKYPDLECLNLSDLAPFLGPIINRSYYPTA